MSMNDDGFFLIGEPSPAGHSPAARATALIDAARAHPFVTFVETRLMDARDVVVVEIVVELPSDPAADIRATERLALVVGADELTAPTVLALRKDFPEDLPHTNLTRAGEPRDLCLSAESYFELADTLTQPMFLERIGRWLARAAMDGLHLPDQPLEPLLLTNERIIIDPDLFDKTGEAPLPLLVGARSDSPPILEVLRLPEGTDVSKLNEKVRFLALPVTAQPWHSRLIQSQPRNVEELTRLLSTVGIDLLAECGRRISRLYDEKQFEAFSRFRILLLLKLPKVRQKGGDEEAVEWWAFVLDQPLAEFAVRLGVLAKNFGSNSFGRLLGTPTPSGLDTVKVYPLKPVFAFSKLWAELLSGRISEADPKVVAVGAGALGSQVVIALARQGFGTWKIVDDDVVLPHNLARHALGDEEIGLNKAVALVGTIRSLLNSDSAAAAIPCNLLRPGEHAATLETALAACDLVLDCSASPAAGRELAHRTDAAPRISAFIAPSGKHLVILAEGQERSVRLDDLDAQLAAAAAEDDLVRRAFSSRAGSVNYAGACRDNSVVLPQDVVQTFAGVVARFVRGRWDSVEPFIGVWEWCDETYSLTRHVLPAYPPRVICSGGWEVRIAARAGAHLRKFRRLHLPNETGGVLLGNVDSRRRVVRIGLALPSPPDSVEWPDMYIRGADGLRDQVNRLHSVSGGQLTYVGEWHSHPPGSSVEPSDTDRAAFSILQRDMVAEGLPTLMLIQSDDEAPGLLIG
jgi:integrative and conjugative element protein (TIGR02256 family)